MVKKKTKYYAVKGVNKLFTEWKTVEKLVKGVSGAKYKSFTNLEDAQAYLSGDDLLATEPILEYDLNIFIDGSFNKDYQLVGSGIVVVDKQDNIIFEKSFSSNWGAEIWNVAGELQAALGALYWLTKRDSSESVGFFYDYAGVEAWATKEWKAKNEITAFYRDKTFEYLSSIQNFVVFRKIKAHSGIKWNEYADKLAKNAVGLS